MKTLRILGTVGRWLLAAAVIAVGVALTVALAVPWLLFAIWAEYSKSKRKRYRDKADTAVGIAAIIRRWTWCYMDWAKMLACYPDREGIRWSR